MIAEGAPVLLQRSGARATITLNRPDQRNALNLECWRLLEACAATIAADSSIRVVLLTGTGTEAFSAGADIGEFATSRRDVADATDYGERCEAVFAAWQALPQPVVARLHGYCLGAGFELALCADLRLASDTLRCGVPAVQRGFGVSLGDLERLRAVTSAHWAKRLLLTGEELTAAAAHQCGLLDLVVPAAELDAAVEAVVRRLERNAPLAMAWVKRLAALADDAAREQSLGPAERVGAQLFATTDAAEGAAAFRATRPPRFTGE